MAGPAPATRPILASLEGYRPAWLKGDIAAGLAIAAVGLPTAIAYPAIAGLSPETGLYASIAPLVAYAVFGPSRQLIVGPDAATITVMAAVLATIPDLAPPTAPASPRPSPSSSACSTSPAASSASAPSRPSSPARSSSASSPASRSRSSPASSSASPAPRSPPTASSPPSSTCCTGSPRSTGHRSPSQH